ncbi:MAG: LacI family DNA-binding transcriptional regulator [Candidatus Sulfotelmatobacter sp.]
MSEKKMVVTLRTVAERVGLAPCSVSAVLNKTPASLAIPQHTKDRVFRAAAELNYQPNFSARSLRTKRTHMVAVISNDFGRVRVGQVVAGMERMLRRRGYLLALGVLERPSEWTRLSLQLYQRGVEGVMVMGVSLPRELTLPAVSVHLGCLNLEEPLAQGPLAEDAGAWLRELGESAAQTMLSKIENKSAPRRTRIVFKPPHTAFGFPGTGLGVSVENSVQFE